MSDTGQGAANAPAADERIKETSGLRKALIRPELGAIVGTIAVFAFFLVFAGDTVHYVGTVTDRSCLIQLDYDPKAGEVVLAEQGLEV